METTPLKKRTNLARRERLNPDWPIVVLNFPAQIIGEVPQAVWENSKQMNELWNEFCAMFERASTLDVKDGGSQATLSKDDRKAIWLPFGERKTVRTEKNAETYDRAQQLYGGQVPSLHEISGKYRGIMPSAYYEAVLARFLVTVKEWQKSPATKGPPKPKHGLRSINLPIIFNEGTTLSDLESGRNVSLRYTEHLKGTVQAEAYINNGHFCVGKEGIKVPLHVAYSRPLEAKAFRANHAKKAIPEKHRVKAVSLVGHRKGALGWKWSIQIRLEHEPSSIARQLTGRQCGVDMGWRVREDGIRLFCLTDNEGRIIEGVLPFQMLNRDERRNQKRFGDSAKVCDWRKLQDLARAVDEAKDTCKASLKEISAREQWPDEAQGIMKGFARLGRRGIIKLLQVLPSDSLARPVIEEWLTLDRKLSRAYRGTEDVLMRTWGDLRAKLAAWLTTQYDVIAIKKELNLKTIAEQWVSTDDAGLDQGRKWRQRASLHEFRQLLNWQAQKRKCELQGLFAPSSPIICMVCGNLIEPGSKLILECEQGHKNDQDANASSNLLLLLGAPACTSVEPLMIPTELQRYLRVVSNSL